METKIIAAIAKDRSAYDSIEAHVNSDMFSAMGKELFLQCVDYYEHDAEATSIDIDIIEERVARKLTNKSHIDMLKEITATIKGMDVSAVNVAQEVLDTKVSKQGHKIAGNILDGKPDAEQIRAYLELLDSKELHVHTEEEYVNADVEELVAEQFDETNVIKVGPPSLNKRLKGRTRRGHHVIVTALAETGKTLAAINMAAGIAYQGHRVLYVGNEDPIADIILRTVSNMSGRTTDEIIKNPKEAQHLARTRGYGNVAFVGLAPGTIGDIRALVRKHEADAVIVDQIRNLRAANESFVNRLETVARGMRDIARTEKVLAISLTQAAESARDKLVLDTGDVDSSNVGIPGANDAMLMIGSNDHYSREGRRMFTLAKNKVTGVHDNWPVSFIESISRVQDIEES